MKISRTKTEYLFLPFSDAEARSPDIYLDGQLLRKSSHFKYLGSTISNNGTCHEDVIARTQTSWMKWHQLTGVLCDRRMPLKLKGKIHKSVIRPAMLFASECWTMFESFNKKLEATEMKMLRLAKGVTKLDKIRSEKIRDELGITESIADKLEERQLKWYGHVKRRQDDDDYIVTHASKLSEDYLPPRTRGRPRNNWKRQMETKLSNFNIREEVINDRGRYRLRIHTRKQQEQRQPQA